MRHMWLALGSLALIACAPRAQTNPRAGSSGTPYICGGGVVLNVAYRQNLARVNYGGVVYTLYQQNGGVVPGNLRFADPVTSWSVGGGGGVLRQNGVTLAAGCQPAGGGSSTVIPVFPGDGGSTVIPVPDDDPSTVIPVPSLDPSASPFGPGFDPTFPPPAANTVNYACDDGQGISVSYLGSSAVQVFWQGGRFILDQTQSASGVRYTNGFYSWVTKGNQGFLTQTGLNRPEITIANNCVATSP